MKSGQSAFAIVVPTCNRSLQLRHVLSSHCHGLQASGVVDVDIVVSDNWSTDDTDQVVQSLAQKYPNITVIRPPRRLSTVDENIAFALQSVTHAHVWLFGDDALPHAGSVARIRRELLDNGYDLVLANMRRVDAETGDVLAGRTSAGSPTHDTDFDGTIEALAERYGFRSALACGSAIAFRRTLFVPEIFDRYFGLSPVNAHGAAIVDGFAGARCLFVSQPMLDHRVGVAMPARSGPSGNRPSERIFDGAAAIGIVRLFRELRERGRVGRSLLFKVQEQAGAQVQPLWAQIVGDLLDDLEQALSDNKADKLPTPSEITEIVDEFAMAADEIRCLECARRTQTLYAVARALLMRLSPLALTAEGNMPMEGCSLPHALRMLDDMGKSDVRTLFGEWFVKEIAAVRSMTGQKPGTTFWPSADARTSDTKVMS